MDTQYIEDTWPNTKSMERHLNVELLKEIELFEIQVTLKCNWHLE